MGLRVINKVYTDLEGRTGKSMQGNYMDKSIVQYDVEYDAKIDLSNSVSVLKQGAKFILTKGTWFDKIGAFKGANIDFRLRLQGNAISTTIDYVDGAEMTLINGGNSQDGPKLVGFFQVTDAPELFEVDFNLVQNSISVGSRFSLIDGETQRFSVVLANALTIGGGIDNFIQLGKKSGGSEITSNIDRIADSGAGNQRYTILINYKNPLLFDEELYKADDCIGDYARIRVTAQRGNDNVFVDCDTKNIGDTGYEDEALNGGAAEYVFNTLVWTDGAANVMEAMDYSQPSNFAINITGTFTAAEKYGVKLFRIPQDESEYKNKALNLERNLSLCMNDVLIADGVPTSVAGDTNADGAAFDISGFTVTDNGTDVDVVGLITPNEAMITLLGDRGETDKDYKLLIVIDDTTKAYRDANTVNVLCDSNNAVKNKIPLGTWGGVADFNMIGSDGVVLTGTPALLIESDNRMNVTFTLPKNTNFVNPWLSMTGQIVATRISTGERFIYKSEEYVYDISQLSAERPSKILLIDYEQTKGRKLPAESEFNDVTFELNPFLDTGTDFGVQLNYSFQVGYQDWIEVPEISNYFEGEKNNNWYNISNDPDWGLSFEFVLEHEDGTYTNSKDFTVTNYGAWTGAVVKTYVDEDSQVVTRPLANQTNTITAVATGLNPFTGNEYASISVRDKDGVTLGQIATDIDPLISGNPLQPIAGETRLKITVLSNVATLVCLIDTKLIDVKKYTIVIDFNADV